MYSGSWFSFINGLTIKRDTALITVRKARYIQMVLTDPKDTAIGSPSFR